MPVAAIASKPGRLDCQHGACVAIADRDEQAFKTLPGNAAARATKIIVDDDYILPSESFRSPFKCILATTALRVVGQLIRR